MKRNLLFIVLLLMAGFGAIGQITTVGLIGSGTPNGWESDIDMVQDAENPHLWTLETTLVAGEVKFRAENDWAINWGSSDFPTGIGVQNGPNIPVFAGDYMITFNSETGAYNFLVDSPIGLIGSATPDGWNSDVNMYKDTSEHGFFLLTNLVVGEAKFRKDDDWAVNWGAVDFPSGIGVQNGPNIPIPKAGKYYITFDTLTGAYNFTEKVDFEFISLIGDATPGGWETDTDLTQKDSNPDEWTADVQLADGSVKFRANHAWTLNWGGTEFPMGTAVVNGDNIPVTEGTYRVTFNTASLAYNFQLLEEYTSISLIGSAVPGGENWDKDLDLTQSIEDPVIWKGTYELNEGEAKFRANYDWAINWGGPDFPGGIAVQDGANIPVAAGRYKITFNSLTGEYYFEAFVVYDQISIIGKNGPASSWDVDTYLTISPDNDQIWTITGATLSTADQATSDSGIKFRANSAWTVNWGSRDFPSGTGTQDGPNIWCTEGVWDCVFNTLTGEYTFTLSSSAVDVLDPAVISVFPNPATSELNIDLSAAPATKAVNVNVYDMSGRKVMSNQYNTQSIKMNITSLQTGNYFIQIVSDNFMIGKQFTVKK